MNLVTTYQAMVQWTFLGWAVLLVAEIAVHRLRRAPQLRGYALEDSMASLAMGVVAYAIAAASAGILYTLWVELYRLAPIKLGFSVWLWPLAIVLNDFCYYWFHRAHHVVRVLWASHVSHHSSTRFNFSTAARQSWTDRLTGFAFWIPLPLAGIDPLTMAYVFWFDRIYQFCLHTELVGKLGPLEWALVTPSHHRVHHGRNDAYRDRNFGGISIVWDRLFGTFAPETVAVDYGLKDNIRSYNPIYIAFHEWARVLIDVVRADGIKARLRELMSEVTAAPGATPRN